MIYIKNKKPKIENLRETYTESIERGYSSRQVNIGYAGLIVMLTLLFSFSMLSAQEPVPVRIDQAVAWGAGDTWTCDACGTTNYDWQCSCYNCGKWR
jgi:hypothetical protein